MAIKYIMFTNLKFILIPEYVKHNEVVMDNSDIKSAGFVKFISQIDITGKLFIKAECYGESISLKIASNPIEDDIIINNALNKSW